MFEDLRIQKLLIIAVSLIAVISLATPSWAETAAAASSAAQEADQAWWLWPIILLAVTFVMGILAVLGGIGGGVLFVPIISGFFPFHLDFVRGAGLMVALTGALAAGPSLLKMNLASLRLAMPAALIASISAIFGAMIGLAIHTEIVHIALGVVILVICIVMITARKSEYPVFPHADRLSSAMRICGIYQEVSTGETIDWKVHRTPLGLFLFVIIGFGAGMFGLGAGWANVPVLNIVMGAPLKISVATSKFLLSVTDTSAAWIYMNKGCLLPLMVVPSIVGIMLGSFVGVRTLKITKPTVVRWIVIGLLAFAGVRTLLKGLGI